MVKKISVCCGPTCGALDAEGIVSKLNELIVGKEGEYEVETCGCMGHCENAPNVMVDGEIVESVNLDEVENDVLLGKGKKAKTLEEYDAEELTKDNFLNDI